MSFLVIRTLRVLTIKKSFTHCLAMRLSDFEFQTKSLLFKLKPRSAAVWL